MIKKYSKLNRFPLGAIKAEGFLKDQMKLGKDGMCGHLHELEPEMIAAPFVNKVHVKAWGNGDQSGWGAEISGNYWTGYIQFAYVLGDEEMKATATEWVNNMLKNRRADGYLGTYYEDDADIYDDYNAWGTGCVLRGLIAFYEATGREDVFDAVYKCLLWFCNTWTGDKKTCYAGQFIIEPMVIMYHRTGDERLREFAEDYLKFLCKHDIFDTSYEKMLYGDLIYNSNHTAGLGTNVRLPALVYAATGNEDYLRASERRINQILEKSVQLSGGPVSVTEYVGPVGSTTETEYCSYTFYNASYSCMSCITGNAKYGDLMENMFYNGAQGARKKDEKAIAYFNSPNQIYATNFSSSSCSDHQVYAPCYPVSCCPVNAVAVVPEFIRGMILRDDAENVYAMAYGPCRLEHNGISISEETLYPFRNSVSFLVECDKAFAFNLKIPGWANGYEITLNGEKINASEKNGGFVEIKRVWECGDRVEISFKAEVEIVRIDDSDCASSFPLGVKYGALVFAYHIPEKWSAVTGRPMTPLPKDWSWYHANPVYEEAAVEDAHERIGLRRKQFTWNVALDENLRPEDFEVEELEENGYAWSNPLIRLHTHCYKAPYVCAPYQFKTLEYYGEYQRVTEKLPLVLEPYGCTNLRITYFPKAKLN